MKPKIFITFVPLKQSATPKVREVNQISGSIINIP